MSLLLIGLHTCMHILPLKCLEGLRCVYVGGDMLLGMGSFEVSKVFTSLNVCLALCLLPLAKDVVLSFYRSATVCLRANMLPIMKTKLLTL